jgi:hypothetical protein
MRSAVAQDRPVVLIDLRQLQSTAANIGGEGARRDGVDRDVVTCQLKGGLADQMGSTCLGRHIGRADPGLGAEGRD